MNRRALLLAVVGPVLANQLACASSHPDRERLALTVEHVTLIDGSGGTPLQDVTIVMDSGRILAVGKQGSVRSRGRVIDGSGMFAIPGMWDMHLHLAGVEEIVFPLLLRSGVTSVRDMGDGCAHLRALRDSIRAGQRVGPRIYMAGRILESAGELALHQRLRAQADSQGIPHVETQEPGCARLVVATAADAQRMVDSVLGEGADFIKARSYADPAVFAAIAAAAKARGVTFASHPPYALGALESAAAGATTFEHGFYPWPPSSLDAAQRQQLFDTWRVGGTALVPTFITWEPRAVPIDSVLAEINDSLAAPGTPRGDLPPAVVARWRAGLATRLLDSRQDIAGWREVLDAHLRDIGDMYRHGVRIMPGTDGPSNPLAYPGSGVIDELELFVRGVGLSPMEAIVAATRHPAETMRIPDLGTIAPGQLADMVLLSADPLVDINNLRRVHATIADGRIVWQAEVR